MALVIIETIVLIIGLMMAFMLAVSLGANDAATPTDCAVGAGVISIRKAVVLFAIFTAVGAIAQGYMVMKTLGRGIVPEISVAGAFACVVATFAWVTLIASLKGMDVSVTHSITGAVFGYGLIAHGLAKLNYGVIVTIVISWFTSPLSAVLLSFALYRLITFLIKALNVDVFSYRFEKVTSYFLIGSLMFSAYSFGVNDIANATGVYVTVASKIGQMPDSTTMFLLAVYGSIGIAVGGVLIGPRVIVTMAYRITRLDPIKGLAAELSNALVVYLFSTVPYILLGYGMPISTSLASAGSLLGVGLASGGTKGVNWRTVSRLGVFWVTTVPATATISMLVYLLLKHTLGLT